MTDIAAAFVAALAARGVTLQAHGKKGLAMVPKSAYGEMSAEERVTLKLHKAAIIAVVREGKYATTTREPAPQTATPRVEKAKPCPYCYQSPCVGVEHPAFATLHPEARPKPTYDLARLRTEGVTVKEAITDGASAPDDPTAVMMRQLGKPLPEWWWR